MIGATNIGKLLPQRIKKTGILVNLINTLARESFALVYRDRN